MEQANEKSRRARGRGQAGGSTLSEPRRLHAEVLAAAGQLKPGTIKALPLGGPGTGPGALSTGA